MLEQLFRHRDELALCVFHVDSIDNLDYGLPDVPTHDFRQRARLLRCGEQVDDKPLGGYDMNCVKHRCGPGVHMRVHKLTPFPPAVSIGHDW
jgi:hypothetical protein